MDIYLTWIKKNLLKFIYKGSGVVDLINQIVQHYLQLKKIFTVHILIGNIFLQIGPFLWIVLVVHITILLKKCQVKSSYC